MKVKFKKLTTVDYAVGEEILEKTFHHNEIVEICNLEDNGRHANLILEDGTVALDIPKNCYEIV